MTTLCPVDVAGHRPGSEIRLGGEGSTAAAQKAWAGNGSSCGFMMSLTPNKLELTAKENFLKTMMELVTSGQEMKNSGVRTNSLTPGGREERTRTMK